MTGCSRTPRGTKTGPACLRLPHGRGAAVAGMLEAHEGNPGEAFSVWGIPGCHIWRRYDTERPGINLAQVRCLDFILLAGLGDGRRVPPCKGGLASSLELTASAQEYAQMHPQMYVINDLEVQENLLDRRRVYEILKVRLEL
eukprot:1195810-Prorocentrum_minimum.AAC.2